MSRREKKQRNMRNTHLSLSSNTAQREGRAGARDFLPRPRQNAPSLFSLYVRLDFLELRGARSVNNCSVDHWMILILRTKVGVRVKGDYTHRAPL